VDFVGLYYVSSDYSGGSKGCGNVTHKSERVWWAWYVACLGKWEVHTRFLSGNLGIVCLKLEGAASYLISEKRADWIDASQDCVKWQGLCKPCRTCEYREWPWLTDYVPFLPRSCIVLIRVVESKVFLHCWVTCSLHVELVQPLRMFSCYRSWSNPWPELGFSLFCYRSDFVVINEKGRRLWWVRRRCG